MLSFLREDGELEKEAVLWLNTPGQPLQPTEYMLQLNSFWIAIAQGSLQRIRRKYYFSKEPFQSQAPMKRRNCSSRYSAGWVICSGREWIHVVGARHSSRGMMHRHSQRKAHTQCTPSPSTVQLLRLSTERTALLLIFSNSIVMVLFYIIAWSLKSLGVFPSVTPIYCPVFIACWHLKSSVFPQHIRVAQQTKSYQPTWHLCCFQPLLPSQMCTAASPWSSCTSWDLKSHCIFLFCLNCHFEYLQAPTDSDVHC